MRYPLICSLLCNFALLAWILLAKEPLLNPSSEGSPNPHRVNEIVDNVAISSTVPTVTAGTHPPGTHDWMDLLRRHDAPASILFAVASVTLLDKYRTLEDNIRIPPGTPKWAGRNTPPTADQQLKIEALRAERDSELKALLGDAYAQAMLANQRRPVGLEALSDEKMLHISTILADYQAAIRKEGRGIDAGRMNIINDAKEQEIAKVLSPDEYKTYRLYTSESAKTLQLRLRNVPITDQEYETLFVALDSRRAKQEPGTRLDDFQEQLAEIEVVSRTIGVDHAAVYAYNTERSFQPVYNVLRNSGMGPDAVIQRYRIWLEFYSEIGRIQNTAATQQETLALGRSTAQAAYEHMTKGLSPDDVARFTRTQTGVLLTRFLSQ